MSDNKSTWAIVLAAGDGKRLHSLTTDHAGNAVPKQFCSLDGGASLLQETLDRALSFTTARRIVAIVADAHRHWWGPVNETLPGDNIVAQPCNRGTGNGILLPLLHVMNLDPDASVVILPSDHYIRNESVLRDCIGQAIRGLDHYDREIVLLGITPDSPDPELGYIKPSAVDAAGFHSVEKFVEKPEPALAVELQRAGGVWNSFIMVARAQALLDIYATRFPEVVMAMVTAMQSDATGAAITARSRRPPATGARSPAGTSLHRLYADLPDIDFSRHVISGFERRLRLLPVPHCGWSDLGTPERVARTLTQMAPARRPGRRATFLPACLDLATAHLRLLAQA